MVDAIERAELPKCDRSGPGYEIARGIAVEDGEMPKDSDGSAKIAIIALERSINAWMKLYELMPATEDTALNALALLSKIKTLAVDEFPQAMQFVRPGFDE